MNSLKYNYYSVAIFCNSDIYIFKVEYYNKAIDLANAAIHIYDAQKVDVWNFSQDEDARIVHSVKKKEI